MTKPKHRRKHKDPLVPLSPGALRAAIEEAGISQAELARRADTSRQLLRHHTQGDEVGRCRKALRRSLAQALHVPEALLGGDDHAIIPELVELAGSQEFFRSNRVHYMVIRLMSRVLEAFERDFASPELTRQEHAQVLGYEAREWGDLKARIRRDVVSSLGVLLMGGAWQRRLLRGTDGAATPLFPPMMSPVEHAEEANVALITAFAALLEPWLEGEKLLDYRQLARVAGRVPTVQGSEAIPPTSPIALTATNWRG